MPLWKKFRQNLSSADERDGGQARTESAGGKALWESFDDPRHPQESPPTSDGGLAAAVPVDVAGMVLGGAHDRTDAYVRELFDGNKEHFNRVMIHLAEAPDWTSASSIIADEVFKAFRIDIYSDIAVDFTNAVEARYSGNPT